MQLAIQLGWSRPTTDFFWLLTTIVQLAKLRSPEILCCAICSSWPPRSACTQRSLRLFNVSLSTSMKARPVKRVQPATSSVVRCSARLSKWLIAASDISWQLISTISSSRQSSAMKISMSSHIKLPIRSSTRLPLSRKMIYSSSRDPAIVALEAASPLSIDETWSFNGK